MERKPGSPEMTADAMRALERAAMAAGAVSGETLMERAGAGVVAAIAARWPQMVPGVAVVLCGPGNNGGDGYVIARLLAEAGWQVSVRAFGDPAALRGDARTNHDRYVARGHPVRPLAAVWPAQGPQAPGLVVEALFGIGQNRPVDALLGPVRAGLEAMAVPPRVVSVDIPIGWQTDTGAALAARPLLPDLTVTFHARKPVHRAIEAAGGAVDVVDIGL